MAARLGARVASPEGPPVLARANASRLETAVSNLLRNALEAGGPAEEVHVELEPTWREVRIRVLDRGAGLPPGFPAGRFEPFRTTKANGMGIGLSIAGRFVEACGGSLALERREGGGAAATIVLPRVSP